MRKLGILWTALLAVIMACSVPTPEQPLGLSSTENVILSEDFDNGANGWSVRADPAAGSQYNDVGIREGRYCVWVGDGGVDLWDVYLYYTGVPLEAGATYRLSFDAGSGVDKVVGFSVKVGNSSGAYTYAYEPFEITGGTGARPEMMFTVGDRDDNARIEFQLGGKDTPQYFCFDNILLEMTEASGSPNLIRNGTFQKGTAEWSVLANPDKPLRYNDAGIDENGRYCVWVGDGGSETYDIYLYQTGLVLEQGATYELSFDAGTGVDKVIDFGVKFGGGAPDYAFYAYQDFQVTGGKNERPSMSFVASSSNDNAQIEFQLGGKATPQYFCFDNIVLEKTEDAPVAETPEGELIQNGNFGAGGLGWGVSASEGVIYNDDGVDEYGRYCVWVGDGGVNPWDIYLFQSGIELTAGTTYDLRFDAITDSAEPTLFYAKVGQATEPYTTYAYSTHEIAGDASPTQTVSFTASESFANAQVEFQLGGEAATRYFCFDNVSLRAQDDGVITPPNEPDSRSLRELAEEAGVFIGAATLPTPLAEEPVYGEIAAREFNMLSPEGSFLASEMHTAADPFSLSNTDGLAGLDAQVDFALENGARVQGFHLIWFLEGSWAPWLVDLGERRREFISTRIQDVMTRYDGKINHYNVVNEAFEQDGTLRGAVSQDTDNWLYEADPPEPYGYIEYAFKEARAADPDAKLYYNDYGTEYDGPKWDAVLEMATDFVERGVPIDGVGFQVHLNMKWGGLPPASSLAEHMAQLAELGLEAQITEFDLGIETGDNPAYASYSEAERLQIQAQTYKNYLNVCIEAPNCDTFQMWGFTDKHSWITQPRWGGSPAAKPLIFDAEYEPKLSYYSVQDALLGR